MIFSGLDAAAAVKRNIDTLLDCSSKFRLIIEEIRPYAYIVGGFIRDSYFGKHARDIDIIVDINDEDLRDAINRTQCLYAINRHGGMKLYLDSIVVDIWTLGNNWAFKSNSISLREDSKLHSIAQGCFYNYDSLVIKLKDYRFNFKYFEEFLNNKELDILEDANYQARNPMLEANILRSFYISGLYKASFSDRVKTYIFEEVVNMDLQGKDVWDCLAKTQEQYPKYKKLDGALIKMKIQEIMKEVISKEPYLFDISHLITN